MPDSPLTKLLTPALFYRGAQFYAHRAHNEVSGPTFFEDHEFLGGLYPVYEAAYDSLVERVIGLGGSPDISALTLKAAEMMAKFKGDKDAKAFLKRLLEVEEGLCEALAKAMEGQTEGTKNLLQDLCDQGEMRRYKLGQRVR